VKRGASGQDGSEVDPAISLNGGQIASNDDSLGGGIATANTRQPVAPAAPLPVGGDVKPAKLLASIPPSYPTLAKTQHVSGDVKVDALIDTNGRVTTMKVISGPTLLHQSAMDALRQWNYQAATLDGKPVAMHLTVTIQFRLQ
jgi:TonB family protein